MFCTFAVSPKDSLRSMRKAVEAKGALVVAQAAFGPGELGAEPGVFGPAAFGEELARQATIQAVSQVLVE
jgi:hypothetical protein